MNSFEYGFFDALEKIAVTAAELREANKRVRSDSGVVSTDDLKSLNLQSYLVKNDLGPNPGPTSLMGSLPIDSVKSGPLKDDLIRRGHKRVMVTTPERAAADFSKYAPDAHLHPPSAREFLRDAVNFHETREAQSSRKRDIDYADFKLKGVNPDRAKKSY